MNRFALSAAALLLAGCSLAPSYQAPSLDMPTAWQAAARAGDTRQQAWWTQFGSDELNTLMEQARTGSLDLAAAQARLRQARANLITARADWWPGLDMSSTATRNNSGSSNSDTGKERYQTSLSASYELDLFGATRSAVDSAQASLEASEYSLRSTVLVLQASVATTFLQAVSISDRIRIAEQNLASARETLALIEVRERLGLDSGLELAQQRASVASQEAELPSLRAQQRAFLNALAVLLGRAPEGFALKTNALAGLTLPAIAAGQPGDLLTRRPDILLAEAQLRAANADIGSARAALFPRITLSAQGVLTDLGSGGNSSGSNLVAGLTAPLFQGGRLRAGVLRSEARAEELAANYRQTVLTGLQEAEDALVNVQSSEQRQTSLEEAARQAREAYRLAELRYKAGSVDFLTVLSAQQARLNAEDRLSQAQLARQSAAVDLFKALGGEWAAPGQASAQLP